VSSRWALPVGMAFAFLVSSFTGPGAATPERAADRGATSAYVSGFSASLFKFKTIVEDDGTGKAGGWQKADATLKFVDGRPFIPAVWACTLTIEMPMRTELRGRISADQAATWSAEVATKASSDVMHTKDGWVPAEFCNQWRAKMREIFSKDPYKGIGPRISA
jgi:hypothetical protein